MKPCSIHITRFASSIVSNGPLPTAGAVGYWYDVGFAD
jgi:hypothetical protein